MSWTASLKKRILEQYKPVMDSSLDSICLVDRKGRIVHFNLAMKNFLGLPAHKLKESPVFCDLLKLAACDGGCCIRNVIDSGQGVRLDEAPGQLGAHEVRVAIKIVPVYSGKKTVGGLVTLRPTTAEAQLQEKYHRIMEMVSQQEAKLGELEKKFKDIRSAIKVTA